MNLTDLQRTELYLSEIYFRAIKEFELHELALKFNSFNEENYFRLINYIEQFKSTKLTTKLSELYDLLNEGTELIYGIKARPLSFSELDMKDYVDDYLQLDSNYIKSINVELLKQPFDSETKTYKKYLKLKKEQLFLELINTIYIEQQHGWKSVSNVVEATYNRYMAEFKKFDVAWLKDEILKKENYLPQIDNLFVTKELAYKVVGTLERNKSLDIMTYYETAPNLRRIKSETIKTKKEIELLNQLLNTLQNPPLDQNLLKKYLPYYGDGEDTSLRKLLSSNEQFKRTIIFK